MDAYVIVQRGEWIGRRCKLGESPFAIGRDPESDLLLRDDTVAHYHAVITRRGGRWSIIDLGSAHPVMVEGVALEPGLPHLLRHGDSIRIGHRDGIVFQQAAELSHTIPMREVVQPLDATARLPVMAREQPAAADAVPAAAPASTPVAAPRDGAGEGVILGDDDPTLRLPVAHHADDAIAVEAASGDDDPTLRMPIVSPGWWGYHTRRRGGASE